jgi:hypothetical protein
VGSACRLRAGGEWLLSAEAFLIMCQRFIEVWEEALKERNTSSRRVWRTVV